MSVKCGAFRIGTSGFQYDDWRGVLYPDDLPKKRWFDHYASRFDTCEINNTFYNLPDEETFIDWREQAPPGFRYALKYSRYGSHMKRLKDPEQHVPAFFDRAAALKSFLGPVLTQLPPNWGADAERLDEFLKAVPGGVRMAVEVRDRSWLCDEVYEVLRSHEAALVWHDLLEDHPRVETAEWTYLRFHGPDAGKAYMGSYSPQKLSAEATRIREALDRGRDVYVYFNNDVGGCAVNNALDLRRYVTGS